MKCQAWVDPRKFGKKDHATVRAAIGLDVLDWDWHCDSARVGKNNAARMTALRSVAVRCGGPIKVSVYSGDDVYDGIQIEYRCDWCRQETLPVGLPKDSEELEFEVQQLVDAREFSLQENSHE